MAKFNYVAKDRDAHVITGVWEANEEALVVKELKNKNLTVISVTEEKDIKKSASTGARGKINFMDLVVFSRQLATLIDSGVSLVVGFNILEAQIENAYLKKIIVNIRSDIEGGNSLSATFAKYPNVFPPIFTNMIKAGETSGSLHEILDRLADYLERTENLKRKIKSSLTYPVIVVSLSIGIVAFLLLKVVPSFKNIFESLGGTLPLPTLILITFSNLCVKLFPFIIVALVILNFLFLRYINSEKGRINFDAFKLKLPVFGPIINKIVISRFSRTLATLVRSGVSILEALEVAGKVSGNKIIEISTEQMRVSLQGGENISEPMERTGKFPPFMVKMIAIGEQTGELEKMLSKVSDYFESQVNESLNSLTSMIEPLIITFLGVTVGSIVVAMFLPIFKITQLISH